MANHADVPAAYAHSTQPSRMTICVCWRRISIRSGSAGSSRRRSRRRPVHHEKTPGASIAATRRTGEITFQQYRGRWPRTNLWVRRDSAVRGAARSATMAPGGPVMATMYRYQLPVEQTGWTLSGETQTAFTWEYEDERDKLLALYDKGKKQQWDAAERIDWSQDLDPENPQEIDDRLIPIFGSALWNKLTEKEKVTLRHHQQAQSLSQFMHGEQGALMAAARIVQTVPDLDAKFYAATQVMDEARHVEAYARLLNEKLGIAYPITPGLKALLETVLTDRRWDMTYLGMQILFEGLALAAFQRIRDYAKNRLAASVNAYVMQDEARHVAFGRLAFRDYYPRP